MATRRNRGGRPGREPDPGERVKLGLRVTPQMKARLDTAAKHSGRSQSQEAEFRLERSFDRQDLVRDALTSAYGAELAGLLMMSGLAMLNAGLNQYWNRSDPLEGDEELTNWTDDPTAYDQGVQAINLILEAYRPSGEVEKPSNPTSIKVVKDLIRTIKNKKRSLGGWHDPFAQPLAETIGKLIRSDRLREPELPGSE
jgi:hypothetical protein